MPEQEPSPFIQHPCIALPARRRASARRQFQQPLVDRYYRAGSTGPILEQKIVIDQTGIRSGISGRFAMSQDSQPLDEKKLKITNRNDRNTTRPTAAGNHSLYGTPELTATR